MAGTANDLVDILDSRLPRKFVICLVSFTWSHVSLVFNVLCVTHNEVIQFRHCAMKIRAAHVLLGVGRPCPLQLFPVTFLASLKCETKVSLSHSVSDTHVIMPCLADS